VDTVTEERITKLEMEREQAEKNEDAAKMLAEQSRMSKSQRVWLRRSEREQWSRGRRMECQ
jgi:hypothetical protein